ncbi:ricin-type beta-trefoil lectin domain protein [Mycobacterium innocens]|uniref:ricin-type beta-trefoil lectin domain protein n=1 Tax=Mycobacterium innocens TaxID=2341083 RepID=UPI00244D6C72|nr:ricin-type beta-trefoil lectin domain protein [Mycobacterium innocens]
MASADGVVQLKNRLAGLCLKGPSGNFNAPAVINPCNGCRAIQRWNLTAARQLESVAFPGTCLATNVVSSWLVTLVRSFVQWSNLERPRCRAQRRRWRAAPGNSGEPPQLRPRRTAKSGIKFRDRARC